MMKKKILVVDDSEALLKKLKRNIKKFDVQYVSTVSDAMKLLQKGGISFMVLDIKLKGSSRGYTVFSEIFFKGMVVPGILITGYQLAASEKKYFCSLGALEILQKGGGKGTLSSRIEKSIEKHLKQRNSKFIMINLKIKDYKISNKMMTYNNKTMKLSEWISYLKRTKISIEEEDKIVKQVSLVSNNYLKHEDILDYIFPQI